MIVKNLQTVLRISHTPSSAIVAGEIVIVGSLVCYATDPIVADALGSLVCIGHGEVVKDAGTAWTRGQKIYYDSGDSNFTPTATGNTFAGIASDAAASDAVVGRLLVNCATLNDPGPTAANVVALTDNSGGVDPGDTIAAITEAATITDNSGGVDPGDDTIAVVTNVDTLTDSTGGTADDIIAAVVNDLDATMVPIGGSGMTTAQEGEYDTMVAAVNVRLDIINENNKNFVDQIITQEAANTAITAVIAQLAAKMNVTSVAVDSASDGVAGIITKLNEEIAALKAAGLQASS